MATIGDILGRVARHELTAAEAAPLLRALVRTAPPAGRAPLAAPAADGATGSGPAPADDLEALRRMTAEALKLPSVDLDRPLSDYGLTSITVTALLQAVNVEFGTQFAPTVIFEFTTLRAFAAHVQRVGNRHASRAPAPAGPAVSAPAARRGEAADEIEAEMARLWAEAEAAIGDGVPAAPADPRPAPAIAVDREPAPAAPPPAVAARTAARSGRIAIVGMAGVMPQCEDLDEFWAALAAGRDLITEAPRERWDWRDFADAPAPGARWGGFLRDPASFDAGFFGVSPLEAKLMDPQQRLFLQTVWRALEDAGYRPADLAGSATGVFVGVSTSDYFEAMRAAGAAIDAHTATGFAHSMLANRVSFLFDWRGPSQIIDTACSSSLIALHRAVQAMAAGDCRLALVGGVNLLLTPTMFLSFARAGMLSPDGRCQAFDRRANGYVRGEGVGAVLLKPLEAAEADGDTIHAVILSSAENHGGRATSLTAPNPAVQAELLVQAYRRAGIDPRSVGYIETHGTGTALGDPLEFTGLTRAFARLERERPAPAGDGVARCWLGSVKTNIGHLESAAGIAGLLKTVLALRRGTVPPNLHFQAVNPHIDFAGTRFAVPTQAEPWPRAGGGAEGPRRAGVSSFGFGGAYAHVVLEEGAPLRAAGEAAEAPTPDDVLLSASDDRALNGLLDRWLARVGEWRAAPGRAPALADVAATSRAGRIAERCRLALSVRSLAELEGLLQAARRGERDGRILRGEAGEEGPASGFVADHGARPDTGDRTELVRHWCAGGSVVWSMQGRRRVPLPGRIFESRRYWFDGPARAAGAAAQAVWEAPPGLLAYGPVWVDEPLTPPADGAGVAVLGSAAAIAAFREAAAALAPPAGRWRLVICGEAAREANGTERTIDAASAEGLAAGIRRLREEGFGRLVLLSDSLLPALRDGTGGILLFQERVGAAVSLAWRLIQAASREAVTTGTPPRLAYAYLASGGVDAAREEAVAALLASAFQERAALIGHTVGFEGSALEAPAILGAAAAEAAAETDTPREVRYRRGARSVRVLRERAPDAGPGLPLRPGATYLAAGALGAVGARFAGWLAREYGATVVVLGRRPAGPETAAAVARLDPGAGRVVYRSADVTDRERLGAVVREVVAAHGPLRGVFHLARTVETAPLAAKDEAAFRRVTAAKIEGAVQLDAATAGEPLDFFVLFSSIAADWGVAGAADYACACRFQDAFAAVRQGWAEGGLRRGRTIAIGWPQWRHDAHSHAGRDRLLEERGFALLDEAAGFAWLARTLDPRRTHSAFVCGDAGRLRRMLDPAGRRESLATPASPAEDRVADDERAVRELLAELSDADLEALYAGEIAEAEAPPAEAATGRAPGAGELRRTIRTVLGGVLQLEPDRMNGTTPFDRLGMDSILGVRVVQRLEIALGITVPPRWLVENPTIDSLAAKLRMAWPPDRRPVAPDTPHP